MPSKNKLLKQKEKEEQKQQIEQEKAIDKYWEEGTNKKKERKDKEKNDKYIEKMQKNKEKNDLFNQEQEDNKNISSKIKKSKRVKGDDLDLLNKALSSKLKTKNEKEAEKKVLENNEKIKKIELEKLKQQELQEEKLKQEKLAALKNINLNQDHLFVSIENKLENIEEASNINDALSLFDNNEKTISYNDFYNEKLNVLKNEFPGLKLSQYQQKIKQLWKKKENLNKNKNYH